MNALDVDLKITTSVNSALHMEKKCAKCFKLHHYARVCKSKPEKQIHILMKTAVLEMMIFMLAALRL